MEIKNVGFVVENPAFLIFRDGRKEYDTEKKSTGFVRNGCK